MKRFIGIYIAIAGMVFAIMSWHYLSQVWDGISKHTPPCAPIGADTVQAVFVFKATGIFLCIIAICFLFRRWGWISAAILSSVLNSAALFTWRYWIQNEMLLPYVDFCDKVGMQ